MRSRYIQKDVVEALRRFVGREEWLPLEIALETGLRIGDCVALRREQLQSRDGVPGIAFVASKTGKEGFAPISDTLAARLAARKAGFLFPSYGKSGHITRQTMWARMKRACERAGLDPAGVSPHSLRKNFAVALRHERGIAAVKAALQHSDLAVTRVYAYADTVVRESSDAPIRWRDLELLVEYILERLAEKG